MLRTESDDTANKIVWRDERRNRPDASSTLIAVTIV